MNVLGEGFHKNIIGQISQRQKVYGSGYTPGTSRTPEEIIYLNANTAWCKLMSSTNITNLNVLNNPTIKDLGLTGNELAKRFVLFNGTSIYDKRTTTFRGGVTDTNNPLGVDSKGDNMAYGIGGNDFGIGPMMGIQSVSVTHENRGSLRTANVKIKAWNKAQFEIIDVLYLRLGYSVFLEWGNSMYFDNNGTLISDPLNMSLDYLFLSGAISYEQMLYRIESKRLDTFGNYDAMFGKVKNFHWSILKDGSYDITVDLISSGDIIESLKANAIIEDATNTSSIAKTDNKVEPPENDNELINFYAKKSSLAQFFYYLKYQLDKGTHSVNGDKKRVKFSFSDVPKDGAKEIEEANEEIATGNNIRGFVKNPWVIGAAAALTLVTGGSVGLIGFGIVAAIGYYNDTFQELPNVPTDISPELFKIYDSDNKEITGIVDAIQIPWDDKEGNDETYYVRLGTLLAYMQNYLIPRCTPSTGNTSSPLVRIDYDQNTNIMYAHKWQIAVDPRICVVGRTIPLLTGLFSDINNDFTSWSDFKFSPDCSPFINDKFTITSKENNSKVEYGNIMNIYVNMVYILNKIDELKDDKGKVSLFDLLKGILDGINEGLGGISALEPIVEEISNTIKIIDANPLPYKDEVITTINSLYGTNISTELASFDLYGYTVDDSGVGKSSFIRDFSFTTEITPEMATMITVGAAANGSVVGANSTALSKLNIGLEDRFKKEITDVYSTKKAKIAEIGSLASSASLELSNLKERYKNTIIEYFDFLEEMSDSVGEPTLNTDEVDAYKTTLTNITQVEEQVRNTKHVLDVLKSGKNPNDPNYQATLSPGTGFIQFNLSVTMDGLSGPKIYSKFIIDTRYLPSNYPKSLEFLIKSISHEIQDSRWTTKLESFCISKGKFEDFVPQSLPATTGNKDQNTTTTTSCGTPFTTQVPLTFNNKTSQRYINAFNKAIYNTFRGGKGESGMCSKYTYSTAAALVNVLKGQAPGPQFLSGKGNAKDASTRNFLTSIGYNVVKAGENLSKSDVQKLLNSTQYNIGDIVIYWANDGSRDTSQVKYGHIEIYSGKVWNPYPYKTPQNNFVSSVPDNYTSNPFVYGTRPNQCWTAYVCRVPNI
jgi:hypothetical protein